MKQFFFWLFTVITFIAALAYFISCLTPYISPVSFWPMAFLALGFPYLAILIFLLALVWVFVKRRVTTYLLLLMFAGYQNIFSTLAFHGSFAVKSFPHKDSNTLRILTWNVRNFDNPSSYADSPKSVRRLMFDYIKQSHADVLCLQEFSEQIGPSMLSNTKDLVKLGYVYYYRTNEIDRNYYFGRFLNGTAIFAKVPLFDTGKTILGDPSFPEHLAYADVLLQNKPVRILTAHFKSLNLFASLNDTFSKVSFHYDDRFVYEASRFQKLKLFAQDHVREANIAKAQLNSSTAPVIFTADMNSVPVSYAYYTMSSGLQDAFLNKGNGLGTTLDSLPKTLRIDVLLADKKLLIKNYRRDEKHLSDHFPQFIDVSWKQ